MNRNMYDSDITTWSPQGRIFQIEYAMKAVTHGSASVGIKSNTHVVLATLKRTSSELASHQKKIIRIDDHIGMAISGLAADSRVLSKFMRTECLNHKFVYETPILASRLVNMVADKAQVHTQRAGSRPYGVGLLVAAVDQKGTHLYEICPSGNFFDYKAISIGGRSQSAKTYLEKHFEKFANLEEKELVLQSLNALSTTTGDEKLTSKNTDICIVGEGQDFIVLSEEQVQNYLTLLEGDQEMA